MDEDAGIAQEGLPLTPAMRRFAGRASRWSWGGFAGFFALGLIGFPVAIVRMVRQEPPMAALDVALGLTGVIALIWGLFALGLGSLAVDARRTALNGTYTRHVGRFSVRRSRNRDHPRLIQLEFAGARVKLGYEADIPYEQLDALEQCRSGVIDWLPGIDYVLVVWDDRGRDIFRQPQFGDDPDLLPPPAARRPARPTPAATLRRNKAARRARRAAR